MRRVEIESGRAMLTSLLTPECFGEGLAVVGDSIVQLLWRENACLVHGLKELEFRRALPLPNGMREGWGLTTDDAGKLYASDGTDTLHVLDARTLEVLRRIKVRSTGGPLGSRPVSNLNDLQWVRGEIWANLWYEDRLAVIDPESGNVRGYINLEALLSPKERRSLRSQEECLNGIAYDADADELYVTGKCWPKVRAHLSLIHI